MFLPDLSSLQAQAIEELSGLHRDLSVLSDRSLHDFDPAHTALIIVDMVNGFAVSGALSSPRVGALISPIASLTAACTQHELPIAACADTHEPDSLELETYPPHCLRGTPEAQLCDAIASAGQITIIPKNSTNGFLEPAFTDWLAQHPDITTFLVVGDCTDICVLQFVLTAKAWFNTLNRAAEMIVPLTLTDTFDAPGHPADFMNALSLLLMQKGGISLCKTITFSE